MNDAEQQWTRDWNPAEATRYVAFYNVRLKPLEDSEAFQLRHGELLRKMREIAARISDLDATCDRGAQVQAAHLMGAWSAYAQQYYDFETDLEMCKEAVRFLNRWKQEQEE